MTKWFNLQDIHRDKHMRDVYSSYRGRIARSHAKYARHFDTATGETGRPSRVTLLTREGVEALYDPSETLPSLKPYPVPMRLTDKARAYLLEAGTFSTGGLEKPARVMDRDQFIEFLGTIGNEDLIEPDFIDL